MNNKIKQNSKFLLIYPGEFYSGNWGRKLSIKPHLVYIYQYLSRIFEVNLIDLENEFSKPKTSTELAVYKRNSLNRIFSFNFDVIALSCWSSLNYLPTRYFAEKIKKIKKNVIIIVGGYHPTLKPDDFEYFNSPFDYIIRGTIDNLLNTIGYNQVFSQPLFIEHPKFLKSYPYYDCQKSIGIYLSQGCPYSCKYCMEFKKKWKVLDVKKSINLFYQIKKELSPNYIYICDACFGFDKKWRKEFLIGLTKYDINTYIWLETRVDLFDEEDFDLISQLNIKLDFGVDSFSQTMLKIMGKTIDPQKYLNKFLRLSKKCNDLKILHDAYLIFNHPGETRKTLNEHHTFFNDKINSNLCNNYLRIRFQNYAHFPGTVTYNNIRYYSQKYGTKILYPFWWKSKKDHSFTSNNLIPSEGMKPSIETIKKITRKINKFNSKTIDNSLWEKFVKFNL